MYTYLHRSILKSLEKSIKEGNIELKYLQHGKANICDSNNGGFYGKIVQCMWNLDPGCGKQIYAHIFNPSNNMDDYCCRNIAKVGVTCNRYLGWALSLFEKFKRYAGLIDRRSKITFIECIKRKL